MHCHYFTKTRVPTEQEWAQIEAIANWVVENAPETVPMASEGQEETKLRGTLITLHEFFETHAQELLDDEIELEHSPSNVVQEFMGVPAIRLNGAYQAGGGFFTFTKDNPVNDRHHDVTHCDTARKPYDHLVCAILALIDHQVPGLLKLRSDGSPDDWAAAISYAKGYDPTVTLPSAICALNESGTTYLLPDELDCRL